MFLKFAQLILFMLKIIISKIGSQSLLVFLAVGCFMRELKSPQTLETITVQVSATLLYNETFWAALE